MCERTLAHCNAVIIDKRYAWAIAADAAVRQVLKLSFLVVANPTGHLCRMLAACTKFNAT